MWATSGKWHVGDLATYADQTWLIIDYLVKERKIKKIASFYQDDEYGLDGHLAGKARLKQHDLAYMAEVDYKRADIDFSSQAAKLKESGAEAVILQAVYREPPRLAEQCHAIGYHPLFIGPSPIVLDKTIELGGKHVEGIMGVEVYPLPTEPGPFLDLYRADMKKYFPNLPLDTTNLYGYQKAALFVEAMQRTGRNLTRESLLKAIESIKDWDPGWGLKYSYGGDNRRVMSRAGRLVVVKDGKWTKMSDWMELRRAAGSRGQRWRGDRPDGRDPGQSGRQRAGDGLRVRADRARVRPDLQGDRRGELRPGRVRHGQRLHQLHAADPVRAALLAGASVLTIVLSGFMGVGAGAGGRAAHHGRAHLQHRHRHHRGLDRAALARPASSTATTCCRCPRIFSKDPIRLGCAHLHGDGRGRDRLIAGDHASPLSVLQAHQDGHGDAGHRPEPDGGPAHGRERQADLLADVGDQRRPSAASPAC